MKPIRLLITSFILLTTISCNSQQLQPSEFYVKFKANNITFQILFLRLGESSYDNSSDTTTSIRNFERLTDSVVIDNGVASFNFEFNKNNNSANSKAITFIIEKNFVLKPKEYRVADFDLDRPISFEKRNDGYDGLASVNTKQGQLFSWQYSWVKNHKPAKWTITKVDEATKTISGTFSFNATQTESDENTDMSKRNTFLKINELQISEGEFHLPYTVSNY